MIFPRSSPGFLLALLLLTGCGASTDDSTPPAEDCRAVVCAPCAPALGLRVRVPEERPLPKVTLGEGQGTCAPDGGAYSCNLSKHDAGHYEVDILASGYQSVHLVRDIPAETGTGCCACGYTPVVVNVTLQPL